MKKILALPGERISAVLCDTNRYRRNIGIEIENFRYFRYCIGIGIERGVKEVLVLVSVLKKESHRYWYWSRY